MVAMELPMKRTVALGSGGAHSYIDIYLMMEHCCGDYE